MNLRDNDRPLSVIDASRQTRLARAVEDLATGAARWDLWTAMSLWDLRMRYRRTHLGPLWLTISAAFFTLTLGFFYGQILGAPLPEYLPFLAAGIALWLLIGGTITEACVTYVGTIGMLKEMRLPVSFHAYRLVFRNFLYFLHHVPVIVVFVAYYGIEPTPAMLLVIPGIVLLLLNGLWVSILLGMACTRFRDLPQLVGIVMQIAFLLTPIMWKTEMIGRNLFLVHFNPFAHLLDVSRLPILGQVPTLNSYVVVLIITVVGWAATFAAFVHYRSRLAFWL